MDFGEAHFINSRFNHQLLVIKTERNPGTVYKFRKKNDKQFACASCKKTGEKLYCYSC